ncbi:MAG: LytTR family DNA-binding domain-containing protein [Limnohabitans sp.]|nr:LytTR family DNA-binding domain-containing protein [Limnohabitans sp.]
MRCYIIDDELPAIRIIEKHIAQIPDLILVGKATNPLAAIEEIKKITPDVVFLDISMDEMNGLEVASFISKNTKVVFCTAYSEFALNSYDFEAVDYLVKPIGFARFLKAIDKVKKLQNIEPQNDNIFKHDYVFVKTEQRGKLIKINFDELDYVEAMSNYIAYHCGAKKTLCYQTLKDAEDKLPANTFIRVHKSYIVAIKQIIAIENNEISLKNVSTKIPIGINYKELFLKKMNK